VRPGIEAISAISLRTRGEFPSVCRDPGIESSARFPAAEVGTTGAVASTEGVMMSKTQRKLKKANHGKRPCSAQARRAKRKHIKT